jgi:hypothetical protein
MKVFNIFKNLSILFIALSLITPLNSMQRTQKKQPKQIFSNFEQIKMARKLIKEAQLAEAQLALFKEQGIEPGWEEKDNEIQKEARQNRQDHHISIQTKRSEKETKQISKHKQNPTVKSQSARMSFLKTLLAAASIYFLLQNNFDATPVCNINSTCCPVEPCFSEAQTCLGHNFNGSFFYDQTLNLKPQERRISVSPCNIKNACCPTPSSCKSKTETCLVHNVSSSFFYDHTLDTKPQEISPEAGVKPTQHESMQKIQAEQTPSLFSSFFKMFRIG